MTIKVKVEKATQKQIQEAEKKLKNKQGKNGRRTNNSSE